jgi:hypothetical protein
MHCLSISTKGFPFGQPTRYFLAQIQAAIRFFRSLSVAFPDLSFASLLKCFRMTPGCRRLGGLVGPTERKNRLKAGTKPQNPLGCD